MNSQEFQTLVEGYLTNLESFETKGVKIAGTRARKFAQDIVKEMKTSRTNILAKQKA